MKPKPFSALNHFTVPAAMSFLLWGSASASTLRGPRVAAMITPPGKRAGNAKALPAVQKPTEERLKYREPQLQLRSTVARRSGLCTVKNPGVFIAAENLSAC